VDTPAFGSPSRPRAPCRRPALSFLRRGRRRLPACLPAGQEQTELLEVGVALRVAPDGLSVALCLDVLPPLEESNDDESDDGAPPLLPEEEEETRRRLHFVRSPPKRPAAAGRLACAAPRAASASAPAAPAPLFDFGAASDRYGAAAAAIRANIYARLRPADLASLRLACRALRTEVGSTVRSVAVVSRDFAALPPMLDSFAPTFGDVRALSVEVRRPLFARTPPARARACQP